MNLRTGTLIASLFFLQMMSPDRAISANAGVINDDDESQVTQTKPNTDASPSEQKTSSSIRLLCEIEGTVGLAKNVDGSLHRQKTTNKSIIVEIKLGSAVVELSGLNNNVESFSHATISETEIKAEKDLGVEDRIRSYRLRLNRLNGDISYDTVHSIKGGTFFYNYAGQCKVAPTKLF